MGVDHGSFHILVAEQFLDGANVVAVLEQVGGEGMAKGMATDCFICDASQFCGGMDCLLQTAFIDMVAALST